MSCMESGDREQLAAAIPSPTGRLIGRANDVQHILSLLSDPYARLVTLTGPGGVGKTRLAIEIAGASRNCFGGVWWMDLEGMRDADQVMAAMMACFGVATDRDGEIVSALSEALKDESLLVILDNIEQIPGLGQSLATILARCPGLHLLATGRVALNIRAEQQYPVDPLDTGPPAGGPMKEECPPAIELFVERARAVNPQFQLTDESTEDVVAICRRLDGLPLAIELVAAQTRIVDLADLRSGLDRSDLLAIPGARDLPPRQRTIARTLAWTDDLLPSHLRDVFYRVSVFVGGFTLEAAAAVLDLDVSRDTFDVMLDLGDLVRWSVLSTVDGAPSGSRFRMLESTRTYAFAKLRARGDADAVRRLHAQFYLALPCQASENLDFRTARWFDQMATDHDNLRLALAWSLEAQEVTQAAHVVLALSRFWFIRGYLREGQIWLERILVALGEAASAERIDVMGALSGLLAAQGDGDESSRLSREGLRLAQELGDERRIAAGLYRCGNAARGRGDLVEAVRCYDEARVRQLELGDRAAAAATINNLGIVAADHGDMCRSRLLHEEALAIFRDIGSVRGEAITLSNIGQRLATENKRTTAVHYFGEAIALFDAIGDRAGLAWDLHGLAYLAADAGELLLASRLFGAAAAHRKSIGWQFSAQESREYEREVAALRDQMNAGAFTKAWDEGAVLTAAEALSAVSAIISGPDASPEGHPAGLTEREVDVLRLVADGLTNAGIAQHLSLSPHTVDTHLRRIYRKLEVRSRSAALRFAVEHDLV